jgi:xanthine dehydrogenase iron-sulfur cluster and FAD-binding subunit A
MRASAGYRAKVAANLLRKCFIELTEPDAETRVAFAGRRAHG